MYDDFDGCKERISRTEFVQTVKANKTAFCGLVHTYPGTVLSADCINAIRITAKEVVPHRVKSVTYATVTFDDDSSLSVDFSAQRRFYLRDGDLLEAVTREWGEDIIEHKFYLVMR